MLVGMTSVEYLRKRCLSLAGQELCSSDVKVIDVVLRYGFDLHVVDCCINKTPATNNAREAAASLAIVLRMNESISFNT